MSSAPLFPDLPVYWYIMIERHQSLVTILRWRVTDEIFDLQLHKKIIVVLFSAELNCNCSI